MQFSESWLRSFCNPELSIDAMSEALTMGGLEVESCQPVAAAFTGVVVAHVLDVQPHPDADRLRVCRVDAGGPEPLQIVCGAPNVQTGIKVPCALIGAELPTAEGGQFQIKRSKLRGVESQGMLCSAKELGVGEGADGLMVLDPNAPIGQDLRECLDLNDHTLELKLTPNLAHCLSIQGIARELSALTNTPLQQLDVPAVPVTHAQVLKVNVHATDLCGRFSGRIVKGVNTRAQTPAWMVQKLERSGQRSVNALVDISNFVMFELGQPTHIFDLDKIRGDLNVRWGKAGESLQLLNGNTVNLDESVGVIADDHEVESLAGIMGGDATAVNDDTQNIYIEAAFWWPRSVAGRSRRFAFSTDAGHRFERGVDPQLTLTAIERITQLVLEICGTDGTTVGPIDDQILNLPERKPVRMRVARANRILGLDLSAADMLAALERLSLSPQLTDGVIEVVPPSHRFDLAIEEDLIEEVARMVGFDRLPTDPPKAPISPKLIDEAHWGPERLKRLMASRGFQETINFSFVDLQWEKDLHGNADPIQVLNPIASQMSVMRSSLLGSLLNVIKFNVDRKMEAINTFELGRVFRKDSTVADSLKDVAGFAQPLMLAGMRHGQCAPVQWGQAARQVDFFDIKADVTALFPGEALRFVPDGSHPGLHPGRCARIWRGDEAIGWVGELHPQWKANWGLSASTVYFELLADSVLHHPLSPLQEVSRFPTATRDLAVIVAERITHDQLVNAAWTAEHLGRLKGVQLFDIYRPKPGQERGLQLGEKSMGIRLVLGDDQATLTDEQIDAVRVNVLNTLVRELDARLRD